VLFYDQHRIQKYNTPIISLLSGGIYIRNKPKEEKNNVIEFFLVADE